MNAASPRGRLDGCRARFDAIRRKGGAGADTPAPVKALFPPPGILVAVPPERTARRTGASSGIPPSRTERDGTARRTGRDSGRGAEPNLRTGTDMRRTTAGETVAVDACDACGADLPGSPPPDGSAASCTTSSSRSAGAAWRPGPGNARTGGYQSITLKSVSSSPFDLVGRQETTPNDCFGDSDREVDLKTAAFSRRIPCAAPESGTG